MSVRYDEDDQYYETTIKTDWVNEWDIKDFSRIRVICSDCERNGLVKNTKIFRSGYSKSLNKKKPILRIYK